MNKADSERLESALGQMGLSASESTDGADVVVLNSCVVRQSAEDKVTGLLTSLKPLKNTDRSPIGLPDNIHELHKFLSFSLSYSLCVLKFMGQLRHFFVRDLAVCLEKDFLVRVGFGDGCQFDTQFFQGDIGPVAVWNSTLSSSQVMSQAKAFYGFDRMRPSIRHRRYGRRLATGGLV